MCVKRSSYFTTHCRFKSLAIHADGWILTFRRVPKRLVVFRNLCRTIFMCKTLDFSVCSATSWLRTERALDFIFVLGFVMSGTGSVKAWKLSCKILQQLSCSARLVLVLLFLNSVRLLSALISRLEPFCICHFTRTLKLFAIKVSAFEVFLGHIFNLS